jgi:hypothetical protein
MVFLTSKESQAKKEDKNDKKVFLEMMLLIL